MQSAAQQTMVVQDYTVLPRHQLVQVLHVVNYQSGDASALMQASTRIVHFQLKSRADTLSLSIMAAVVPDLEGTKGGSWKDQVVPTCNNGSYQSPQLGSTKSIVLVRHGNYNRESKFQQLTSEGIAQAHRAGKFLSEQNTAVPTRINFYYSTLQRSVETARIIMSYFSGGEQSSSSNSPRPTVATDVVCRSPLLREVSFNPIGTEPVFKVQP